MRRTVHTLIDRQADELVIGTDGCSKKLKLWLEGRADRSGMLRHSAQAAAAGQQHSGQQLGGQRHGKGGLRLFFADPRTRCIYSSAIVGGRRGAFLPALRTVANHIEANWAQRIAGSVALQAHGEGFRGASAAMYQGKQRRRPPDFYWGEDMVAWNEVALSQRKLQVLSGYPTGPTNLPMYGGLAPNHLDDTEQNASRARGRRAPCAHSERCRHAWLRKTSSMYWFGHKASNSQRYWVMDPACRPPRTVLKQGRLVRTKGAWRLPIRNCTVPFCASAL